MTDHELGRKGEAAAVRYLKEEGWEIVARNFRTTVGEIDVIAERMESRGNTQRHTLAIVEVKTRRPRKGLPPQLSVTAHKRKTIVRVAKIFMRQARRPNASVRFDVIAVDWLRDSPPRLTHLQCAFDSEGRIN